MITEYIEEALKHARYEMINDLEPFYGEIPKLKGVWATGKTLEECRKNLKETLEEWIVLSIKNSLPIPPVGKYKIEISQKIDA
ncbi:MAG: HicB family protein [Mesoaciditoga sp.]|uniref:type II toxin-antitoxin system HicB family antitoxin n=1 Tax=Athalassotoga sp. TaxID=2022597 RepID=UPI000CBF6150|nr:MAG: HicB family protein [Mesoaciditoga sp.]PMP80564.1 MAG: HicB family protein [Mesoaciditoga sp.]HEU24675.1 type II toxin-antitoxin system HicB family antitoxin [Mesoaciditoga lauensis]